MLASNLYVAISPIHAGTGALVWMGIIVVMVAAALITVWWWSRTGAARMGIAAEAAAGALPMSCPACRRSYPSGTTFCPVDACRLTATGGGPTTERASSGGKCPRCRRVYEAGTRFCAVDAEELVPLPVWQATHAEGGLSVEGDEARGGGGAALHFHGEGKICPVCASKYDLEASFCGRDGSELVTVN